MLLGPQNLFISKGISGIGQESRRFIAGSGGVHWRVMTLTEAKTQFWVAKTWPSVPFSCSIPFVRFRSSFPPCPHCLDLAWVMRRLFGFHPMGNCVHGPWFSHEPARRMLMEKLGGFLTVIFPLLLGNSSKRSSQNWAALRSPAKSLTSSGLNGSYH